MRKVRKIISTGLVLLLVILTAGTGCAVKKNPWQKKREKSSRVNTSQLGRNKYYFSIGYQKKLQKSVKKR